MHAIGGLNCAVQLKKASLLHIPLVKQITCSNLQNMRSDVNFNKLFGETEKVCSELNVSKPQLPCQQRPASRYSGFWRKFLPQVEFSRRVLQKSLLYARALPPTFRHRCVCVYFRLLKHKVIRKFWRIERFFSEFLENKFFSRHAAPRHRRPFVFLTA